MNHFLMLIIVYAALHASCYQANTKQKPRDKKSRFVYKETIATGQDTGMIILGSFKRNNIADILCQRWELENREDAALIPDIGLENLIVHEMALFKDSTVVLNPLGMIKFGRWQLDVKENIRTVTFYFPDKTEQHYILRNLSSRQLILGVAGVQDFFMNFSASGHLHQNMYNDPFHPVNNQWRIKPLEEETDSAIYARLKNCLLFFALYYRDHIKTNAGAISFEGLPKIFVWYNHGIGLPDKDELSDSWVGCFYNKEQALTAYSILRKLVVDYEYNWPSGAPGWTYETHSVLEQMYHKIDHLKIREFTTN